MMSGGGASCRVLPAKNPARINAPIISGILTNAPLRRRVVHAAQKRRFVHHRQLRRSIFSPQSLQKFGRYISLNPSTSKSLRAFPVYHVRRTLSPSCVSWIKLSCLSVRLTLYTAHFTRVSQMTLVARTERKVILCPCRHSHISFCLAC